MGGKVEIIVRAVKGGGGVEVAACSGDVFVDRAPWNKLGSLEHQVFKKVSEARPVGPFVFTTNPVEDVGGDDGCRMVLMKNHVESVGQRVLGEFDRLSNTADVRRGSGCRFGSLVGIWCRSSGRISE